LIIDASFNPKGTSLLLLPVPARSSYSCRSWCRLIPERRIALKKKNRKEKNDED
jgi:hypothetical protein